MHLLFQSSGGFVGDGICLYNYFRALPIGLTLYNVGNVASIATIAYLGAKHRKTSTYATFMVHRTFNAPQPATASRLEAAAKSLNIDDQRTEAILRAHIKMEDARWAHLDHYDLTFSAKEAVEIGLADGIAEFLPPAGTTIYNI